MSVGRYGCGVGGSFIQVGHVCSCHMRIRIRVEISWWKSSHYFCFPLLSFPTSTEKKSYCVNIQLSIQLGTFYFQRDLVSIKKHYRKSMFNFPTISKGLKRPQNRYQLVGRYQVTRVITHLQRQRQVKVKMMMTTAATEAPTATATTSPSISHWLP